MQTCEESLSLNFKSARARESTKKRGSVCRMCCRRGHCLKKSLRQRRVCRRPQQGCHDSIPGYFEPHAVLVLPGQQSGLPDDVDCGAQDECGPSTEIAKPSLEVD